MKNKTCFLKMMLQCIAGSSLFFAILTLLSSTNRKSNEIPELFCVQRGLPFEFVMYTNETTLVDYWSAILDFLIILTCFVIARILFLQYKDLSRNRIMKNTGIIMISLIVLFSRVQYGYAATVKVQSWRLIKYGHLYYSVASKYDSYVTVAKNKWNNCKSGSVVQSASGCDVYFYGSGSLSLSINGVTYSSGAIYFNDVSWAMIEEKEKKNCAIHEMGHALGLGENDSSKKNIMYSSTTENCTLSDNDKASYNTSFALSFGC